MSQIDTTDERLESPIMAQMTGGLIPGRKCRLAGYSGQNFNLSIATLLDKLATLVIDDYKGKLDRHQAAKRVRTSQQPAGPASLGSIDDADAAEPEEQDEFA